RNTLQVQYLCPGLLQRGEQAALAASGQPAYHPEGKFFGQYQQLFPHMPAIAFITAIQSFGGETDLAQDVRHRTAALSTSPAIDERMPGLWFVQPVGFESARNVVCDQRRTDLFGLERRLLIKRADARTLGIVQYRAIDRAGDVIFCI